MFLFRPKCWVDEMACSLFVVARSFLGSAWAWETRLDCLHRVSHWLRLASFSSIRISSERAPRAFAPTKSPSIHQHCESVCSAIKPSISLVSKVRFCQVLTISVTSSSNFDSTHRSVPLVIFRLEFPANWNPRNIFHVPYRTCTYTFAATDG